MRHGKNQILFNGSIVQTFNASDLSRRTFQWFHPRDLVGVRSKRSMEQSSSFS